MRTMTLRTSTLLLVAVLAAPVLAQSTLDWPLGGYAEYRLDSGNLTNTGNDAATVYEATIAVEDAVWLRLYFGKVDLETGSYLRMTSAYDNEVQELDAYDLAMWNNTSAYFNGDTVYLVLVAAPGTTSNKVVLEQVGVHQAEGGLRGPCADDDCGICGADNRVPSDEEWTGRLMPVGCTASVYNQDSCLVSAGHCADGGWDDTIQFNVPNSASNCYPYNPPVADQFPITAHLFTNDGVGNDWSVMTAGTNNYGQTPYERYGVYRPLATSPAGSGQSATVWGYGVDNGQPVRSQTQQTQTGTINNRYSTYYTFTVDITYGNSGSALMHNDEIIGVVTHCTIGCPNYATRIDLSAFEDAREQLCGGGGSYCAASSNSTSYEYISNVHVGSINNSSGSSGYANYTGQSTDMEIGTGYPITVTLDTEWDSDIGGLWVDWNQDGDFYDSGETITTSWSGLGPYSRTITPPTGAVEGSTRMRVRIQDGDYDPSLSPCGNTSYGEVEDYTINVSGGCDEPEFIVQPEPSQEVCVGDDVYLYVEVDTLLPGYQWRRGTTELVDGGHIAGATAQTLMIIDITPAEEAGNYNCVVTNLVDGCTATSNNAEILVDEDVPVILLQPQDVTVTEGDAAVFFVGVENPVLNSFQWRRNGVELSDGGRFSGTTMYTLSINPVELGDAGQFDCVVTGLLGGMCSTTSNEATLTVDPAQDCPGDLNGDGVIDLSDLSQLLANYGMSSGASYEDGDIDGDGDVDLADLSALLAVYGTTCP